MDGTRSICVRVSMVLNITEDEERVLFSEDSSAGVSIIKEVISDGRAKIEGETYAPYSEMERFNKQYGTAYKPGRCWEIV